MKTTLQQRAQSFISELADQGVDQVKISEVAGVTKGTVNQWLSGGIKSMKLEYALGIQDEYGYNHRWLVMGEEPKFISRAGGVEALAPASERHAVEEVGLDEVLELLAAYKALSAEERTMILKSTKKAAERANRRSPGSSALD